jgi:hypothetical protein
MSLEGLTIMTDRGTASIEELLRALEDAHFTVTSVGARYRVTHPDGGRPTFVPKRLPKGASLKLVMGSLMDIGFDTDSVERAREARRKARVEQARKEGERLNNIAAAAAAQRTAEAAIATEAARDERLYQGQHKLPDLLIETRLPRTDFVEVDAKFAEELLRANRFYEPGATHAGKTNRKFRPELARRYRDQMLRGEWDQFTHQAIGLDVEGDLVDGQHRLAAIVLAGEVKPDIRIPMPITYDLPVGSFDRIDLGLKRSLGDVLAMHGFTDVNHIGAVLRWVALYDTLIGDPPVPYDLSTWKHFGLSGEQALHMLRDEPTVPENSRAGVRFRKIMLPSAAGTAIHLLKRYWRADLVDGFVDRLYSGYDLAPRSALGALRDAYVTQASNRKYKRTTVEQLALWIKGWNLHLTGKERSLLTWRSHEEFPLIDLPKKREHEPR